MNESVILALISGGVVSVAVQIVDRWMTWLRDRKAAKKDSAKKNAEERLTAIEAQNKAQSDALKFILYDRIKYLAQEYIVNGEVDFDDRRILHLMHSSYHYGLSGNGDLDVLMQEVDKLPLKYRE